MTDQEMLWEYGGDILRSPTMARERKFLSTAVPPASIIPWPWRFAVSVWPENGAGTWIGAVWFAVRCSTIIFCIIGGSTTMTIGSTAFTMPGEPWRMQSGISA